MNQQNQHGPMAPPPLSPCSFSFLRGTLLNSPALTPCHLDSPLNPCDGAFAGRSWNFVAMHDDEPCLTLDAPHLEGEHDVGTWSNDLHEILIQSAGMLHQQYQLQQAHQAYAEPLHAFEVPALASYMSDDSPDSTPVSSDVEDASPKLNHRHNTRRRTKRTHSEIAESPMGSRTSSSASLYTASRQQRTMIEMESDDHVVPLGEADANDEFVKSALVEDSKEAKLEAFPGLLSKARALLRSGGEYDDAAAVNALLSAFTNDDKTGRPLPKSCQELLVKATSEVAAARKRQKEGKTHRRSFVNNQVDESFVCNASGCSKRYTTAEGLRLHIRNHHDVDKKWICHAADCTSERAFVRQADLRMHLIRMHSPVRPFPCRDPACNKTFACHSELRRHIASEHQDMVRSLLNEIKHPR